MNNEVTANFSGFEELAEIVSNYLKATENAEEGLMVAAEALVIDLKKLTKPMSDIRKSDYTHLIDSFAYEKRKKKIVVGWGKYYGRMVENGTSKMSARRHLLPVYEKNKDKYYKLMLKTLNI